MAALAGAASSAPGGPETHDSDLVRRVRRGDDRAFELLYQRYHRRITAYVNGMVHDHARAEDITQDVFVSALRRMRDTDRPIAFKPWVYEIAKNACIDQFRRTRRTEEVSFDADEGLGAADYGRMVSMDARPDATLENKQALDDLRGAFGGLSDAHHEILVMRELEGLSYREIGERLGMSRPSVESTLFRARRRLTEEYEELVSGARCQRIGQIISDAVAADLGARDQRRLARHVSHCQPCRRQARVAGLDIPVTAGQPVRARIAALLPLPLFLRRRWSGLGSDGGASTATSHVSSFAQWSAQLGSTVDPSWIKAAATAATVAVAGVGAGVVGHAGSPASPAGDLAQVISGLSGPGRGAHADHPGGPTLVAPVTRDNSAIAPLAATTPTTAADADAVPTTGAPATATTAAPSPVEPVASGVTKATGLPGRPAPGSPSGAGSTSASGVSTPAVPPVTVTTPGVPSLDTSKAAAGAVGATAAAAQAAAQAVGSLGGGG